MNNLSLIRGGQVLDIGSEKLEPMDILIKDQRIVDLIRPGTSTNDNTRLIDATGKMLIPGLGNAHTHGHGSLGKGMGDKWSLELLLNAAPWLNGGYTLQDKSLAARLNAAEMVLKGTTAAYDLFVEFPQPTIEGLQAVASGYQAVGMRSVVAAMMSDQSFYQAIPGLMDALPENNVDYARSIRPANYQASLDTCRRLLNDWPFDRLISKLALAPTVPLHCSDPFIIGCRDLAEEFDSSIHMHLAESKTQAVSAIERYGKTLTAHIDELGLLSPRFTAAHFVWPDEDDILRMADHGCSVAHNPGSNLRLGSGIAPARAFIENGLTLGIGTDGSSCSDNQNMFEAMRTAAFVSRVASPDYTTWLGASEALDLATRGSAAVLGYDTEMGQLKPGYLADIVFLDLANINFVPLNNAINQLVLCEDSSAVESVMIGGKLVLKNRQFTTFDYDALVEEARIAAQRLSETNADRRALGNELESAVGLFCIGLTQQHYHVQRHLDAKTFL